MVSQARSLVVRDPKYLDPLSNPYGVDQPPYTEPFPGYYPEDYPENYLNSPWDSDRPSDSDYVPLDSRGGPPRNQGFPSHDIFPSRESSSSGEASPYSDISQYSDDPVDAFPPEYDSEPVQALVKLDIQAEQRTQPTRIYIHNNAKLTDRRVRIHLGWHGPYLGRMPFLQDQPLHVYNLGRVGEGELAWQLWHMSQWVLRIRWVSRVVSGILWVMNVLEAILASPITSVVGVVGIYWIGVQLFILPPSPSPGTSLSLSAGSSRRPGLGGRAEIAYKMEPPSVTFQLQPLEPDPVGTYLDLNREYSSLGFKVFEQPGSSYATVIETAYQQAESSCQKALKGLGVAKRGSGGCKQDTQEFGKKIRQNCNAIKENGAEILGTGFLEDFRQSFAGWWLKACEESVSGFRDYILDEARPGFGEDAVTEDEIIALNQSTVAAILPRLSSVIRGQMNKTVPLVFNLVEIDTNLQHTTKLLRENIALFDSRVAIHTKENVQFAMANDDARFAIDSALSKVQSHLHAWNRKLVEIEKVMQALVKKLDLLSQGIGWVDSRHVDSSDDARGRWEVMEVRNYYHVTRAVIKRLTQEAKAMRTGADGGEKPVLNQDVTSNLAVYLDDGPKA